MKRILLTSFAAILFAATAFAGAENGKGSKASDKGSATTVKAQPGNSSAHVNGSVQPDPAKKNDSIEKTDDSTAMPNVENQVQQLRDLVVSQSKEIAATREQVKAQQERIRELEERLEPARANKDKAEQIASPSSEADRSPSRASLNSEATALPVPLASNAVTNSRPASRSESSSLTSKTPTAASATSAQGDGAETSPLQFKIGSAYITPVGFMDLTSVWRSKDGGSGIGTNFAGIPYGGAGVFQTNESELRFSMQNSRIGFRVDANVKGSHVIGYMEADFLGNAPTNLAVSSNSNTLRSRLYWIDLRRGAWEILGGQTWSLATPNRVGVSPLPGDLFFSDNMDTNYQLGDVWGRIPEFRVAYHFPNDKAAFAVALDSPDQYMGGTNGSTTITLPACCAFYQGKELDDGTGTLGPPNRGPDIIAKLAFDPVNRLHFEVGGIARFFQLYNQTTATHFSATGGAGFVNLDFGITNGLRLLTHNYWSDGGGRYIFGQAPDLVVRADGSPSLMHSGSTVDGIEFSHSNTTIFGYYGLVYIPRNVQIDTTGCSVGWGFGPSAITGCPSPSSGQNRSIQEGTVGFTSNFWKNVRYGALSLIGQYSYVTRDPWFVAAGQPNNADINMIFLDLRYTLPGSAPTLGKPGKE